MRRRRTSAAFALLFLLSATVPASGALVVPKSAYLALDASRRLENAVSTMDTLFSLLVPRVAEELSVEEKKSGVAVENAVFSSPLWKELAPRGVSFETRFFWAERRGGSVVLAPPEQSSGEGILLVVEVVFKTGLGGRPAAAVVGRTGGTIIGYDDERCAVARYRFAPPLVDVPSLLMRTR